MQAAGLKELRGRREHLESFFLTFIYPDQDSKKLRDDLNEELGSVYEACLREISPAAGAALREAQRAWLTYRDLNADAAVLAARQEGRKLTRGFAAHSSLIRWRKSQLQEIYFRKTVARSSATDDSDASATPATGDLALVDEFRSDARVFLRAMFEAKPAVLFGKTESFKDVLAVPPELSGNIDTFASRARKFAGTISTELRAKTASEVPTMELLRNWAQFRSHLSNNDVEGAASSLPSIKTPQPEDLSADYLPIWVAVRASETPFAAVLPKFRAHVKRGEALADAGKISDAIREYEAAFQIVEDPKLPKAIKRVRNLSLGL